MLRIRRTRVMIEVSAALIVVGTLAVLIYDGVAGGVERPEALFVVVLIGLAIGAVSGIAVERPGGGRPASDPGLPHSPGRGSRG